MLKKTLITVMLIAVAAQTAFSAGAGKCGWSVLRKANSAKFKAIAVTPVAAVRGDLSGVFYNPSVLALNETREMFFLSEAGLAKDVFGGALYGHPMKDACFAVGFLYYDAGSIELNWIDATTGELTSDTVSAQKDLLGIVSYGRKVKDDLALGATIKAASSSLFEKASALAAAVDIGCLWAPPVENLSVTAAIQNLGASTKFVAASNPLPFSACVGAAYYMKVSDKYYVSPGLDITYLFGETRTVPELGAEIGTDPVSVNIGYRFSDSSNWHFGFTFLKDKYDIAYAFLPSLTVSSTHRLSIGLRF